MNKDISPKEMEPSSLRAPAEDAVSEKGSAEEAARALSTYQWMTVAQLLERLGLPLTPEDVKVILRQKTSLYYQALLLPMMNILNGIVLDQAKEYRLFLQKLLVDFLMSGEADKTSKDPGAATCEAIEKERIHTLQVSAALDKLQKKGYDIIVKVQHDLKAFVSEWKQYLHTAYAAMSAAVVDMPFPEASLHALFLDAHQLTPREEGWARLEATLKSPPSEALKSALRAPWKDISIYENKFNTISSTLLPLIQEQRAQLNQSRQNFHDDIIRVQDLLYTLSTFHPDKHKDAENRERLNFDHTVGSAER